MKDIINDYPWMIYAIIICSVLVLFLIIGLLVTKSKSNGKKDAEDKLISEYLKEEKKASKKAAIEEEYKEIAEAQEKLKQSRTSKYNTNNVTDIEENIEIEENEEMAKVKTKNIVINNKEEKEKRVVNGKYEVFEINESFQYILKASNGEKLIESKKYTTKDNVLKAIDAVKRNLDEGRVSISKDKSGLFQFKLVAANNRPLATSANYTSEQNAKNALNSFKRFAASSPIVEIEAPDEFLGEVIEIVKQDLKVNGKLELIGSGKEWIFQLSANNGELLCTSSVYTSKDNCQKGVDTLKNNVEEGKFEVVKDKNNYYQFKLYSKSNRLIAVGQTYDDKQRAINSANSVASFIENSELK